MKTRSHGGQRTFPAGRAWVRRSGLLVLDGWDRLRGRRPPLLPPRRLMEDVGWGAFREFGEAFLEQARELGGLQPSDRVLEIGCGVGRMAIPMADYLSTGAYEGLDVNRRAIRWCQRHVTPRYPDFRFHFVDLFNQRYNRRGSIPAASFRFPYPDEAFDFVFLTSVFTHMLPLDLRHYIAEIARVLRPGRRCLLTLFLLDDVASGLVAAGGGLPRFSFTLDGAACACRIADRHNPEAAIAYPETDLLEWLSAAGLPAVPPVHYGTWSGRADGRWYQDVLVVERVRNRDCRGAAADSSCPTA